MKLKKDPTAINSFEGRQPVNWKIPTLCLPVH